MTAPLPGDAGTPEDDDLLADLFDTFLQDILEGRTPDLAALQQDRPDLRDRITRTWRLACSVAGRREPSRPVLGGYEIVRELGHGGMGTVYLARHQTLQRDVAIKVLPHSLAMSPRAKQRFLEEARSLARIRHDHVVHIHRIIDHAEMLAFEMEFIDGPSLQSLILALRQQPKPWALDSLAQALGRPVEATVRSSVEWFVRIAIRIARALGEVHRHGLVHRDVKPSNILLRGDGTPLLADFGLALPDDLDATRTNFAGTPVYAAPERLRGGDGDVDARTDVYSLGVTLYEALSTNPPFAGSSTHEVLRRIENGDTPSLRQRAPHVPRDLAVIVHKAMESDPRHRYATADELADDLERLLSLQPILARPAGPLRRSWQFVRRHQKVVAAATAGALLVGLSAWPIAAHAAASREATVRAAAATHRARTRLLAPDTLPASWTLPTVGNVVSRSAAVEAERTRAFAESLVEYDAALRAGEPDERLGLERRAVAAAASITSRKAPEPGTIPAPVLELLVGNATARRRLDDGLADRLTATRDTDRLAGGLFAFLLGDHDVSTRCWSALTPASRDDALVEASTALQLAEQGAHERAYPRLFHAARAFPQAPALALALADAALAAGDAQLAKQWFTQVPAAGNGPSDNRRRLLAADLLAAEGDVTAAGRSYRELWAQDNTDPMPLVRLATLEMQRGNRIGAKRQLESALRRWPEFALARQHLARLALQEHDLHTYLGHLRSTSSRTRRQYTPGLANLATMLRLGGLQQLAGELGPVPWQGSVARRVDDDIPLHAWLRPCLVQGIEQALRLLMVVDGAAELAAAKDQRPLGVGMQTAWIAALRLPRLLMQLPPSGRVLLVAGLPLLFDRAAGTLAELLQLEARALGTRMHPTANQPLFLRDLGDDDAAFGVTALRVDDLDGDTLPDVLLAAPGTAHQTGSGYIEIRSGVDGAVLRTWYGTDPSAMFGRSLAAVGDVDGDLCDDVLVGMPLRRPGDDAVAAVELWSGRLGEVLWRFEDPQPTFGAAAASVGDLDGDGIRDVVVGRAPTRRDDDLPGQALVLSGRTGALLHTLTAEKAGSWFGAAVANAGDVTGDGCDDIVVGGNFGNAPGLVAIFDGRTGAQLTSHTDDDPLADFGSRVLGVPDVDGDGRHELVIAAPARSGGDVGRVLVLGSRTGKALYELRGERPHEGFGTNVLGVADWTRNRQPALVVGTFAGGPYGSGYVRVFDLASGLPLQTFAGVQGQRPFAYSLYDAKDRDGDGYREVVALSLLGNRRVLCFALTFADAFPESKRPSRQPR